MKKVLLTKTAVTQVTVPQSKINTPPSINEITGRPEYKDKLKKVVFNQITVARSALISQNNANVSKTTVSGAYHQRKSMHPEYQELFRALFRLPDKSVQQRVIDAINGISTCSQCRSKQLLKETSTQTDVTTNTNTLHNNSLIQHSDVYTTRTTTSSLIISKLVEGTAESNCDGDAADTTAPIRKKRKRKLCLPQVIKKSHAQQAQKHLQPKMRKPETPKKTHAIVAKKSDDTSTLRARKDSEISISNSVLEFGLNLESVWNETFFSSESESLFKSHNQLDVILHTMANDFIDADVLQDGLYPIHQAIIDNDCNALNRQLYIWQQMKKVDVNEIITDEDEDCLQLAINHDSHPSTIKVLLYGGLNANSIDAHSNTVIHLAIINEIDLNSLCLLMKKIDLALLVKLNDDGYTPLHLAVRNDFYKHAEVLLDTLDEFLVGSRTNEKRYSSIQDLIDENDGKSNFLKYYLNACKHLGEKPQVARVKQKVKLLECGDMKGGNTALFYAIENQMEHFIYFLLAHLTDPRIENHSGQDAKSFFGEFCKSLNLSLQMDKAMEAVITMLDKK